MELRHLTYFVAVAEELHFGRAAERLGIAQPPLSRQIAALERELGARLFERGRGQIALTQAGDALLGRARGLLAEADRTAREVGRIGRGFAGTLRVGFVGSATYGPLPAIIRDYRAAHPEVDLSLASMNNADLDRALARRELDVAVARPRLPGEAFRTLELLREPLILALPAGPAIAGRVPLSILADATLIVFPRRPRPSFADHVLGVLRDAGIACDDVIEAQDYQTAISLVSVGVGIALVPASVGDVVRPGVAFHPYEGPNPGTALSLHARRDNRERAVSNLFEIAAAHAGRVGA